MVEKFTFDFAAHKKKGKIILVKEEGELRIHVALKLLAYLMFYRPDLRIEADAGMHYKPDLVLFNEEGRPDLWVDCGQIALIKVESLLRKLRRTRIVIVKAGVRELRQFKGLVLKKIEGAERLEFVAFEEGFVSAIADAFGRNNQVTFYSIGDNAVGVVLNDQVFESDVYE